jgi:hypothetical protein
MDLPYDDEDDTTDSMLIYKGVGGIFDSRWTRRSRDRID